MYWRIIRNGKFCEGVNDTFIGGIHEGRVDMFWLLKYENWDWDWGWGGDWMIEGDWFWRVEGVKGWRFDLPNEIIFGS
jgi:hypothetical protein